MGEEEVDAEVRQRQGLEKKGKSEMRKGIHPGVSFRDSSNDYRLKTVAPWLLTSAGSKARNS